MADTQSITENIDLFMLSGIAMSFLLKVFAVPNLYRSISYIKHKRTRFEETIFNISSKLKVNGI